MPSTLVASTQWAASHAQLLDLLYTLVQYMAAKTRFAAAMRSVGVFQVRIARLLVRPKRVASAGGWQSKPVCVYDIAEHLVSYEVHELLTPHEHAEREVRYCYRFI